MRCGKYALHNVSYAVISMRKTRNYDWFGLIQFNDAVKEFEKYQLKHKNISLRRCARSFCLKKKYTLWSIFDPSFCNALKEVQVNE